MKYYTHAGFFHCDEVTGCAIVRMSEICGQFQRLTDIENLPTDGLIADIGREYDPANLRFDHHQGFITRPDGYPYASAGLLWKEYGEQTVKNTLPGCADPKAVAERVDERLIKGIDAHDADNSYSVSANCSAGEVPIMTLPMIVASMNYEDPQNHELQLHKFQDACSFMENVLESAIKNANEHINAVSEFSEKATFCLDNKVCILSEGLPWREIVYEQYPETLFVISPSNHPGNPFSMIAVSVSPTSRELKTAIERPDWFKGFIHQGKWIAGGESVDQLVELAKSNL